MRFSRRSWQDLPLASKLWILLVSLVIVPLIAIAPINTLSTRAVLLTATRTQNLQRARGTAAKLDTYLGSITGNIEVLAAAPDILGIFNSTNTAENDQEVDGLLRQAVISYGYGSLSLVDESGRVLYSTREQAASSSVVTAPWFLSATAGRAVVDEPRYDPNEGSVSLHFSAPVRDAHKAILGAIVGQIDMEAIHNIIAADTNYARQDDVGILWDDQGIRISHGSDPSLVFVPIATLDPSKVDQMAAEMRFGPNTRQLLTHASGNPEIVNASKWLLYNHNAEPYLNFTAVGIGPVEAAIVPLQAKRWLYAIATPEKAIMRQVYARTQVDLLTTALIALAVIGGALVAANWVTRPLRAVAAGAAGIAAGDMTHRVRLRQRDEIGQMAAAFDSMADALMDKENQLTNYARDLELRVDERTRQLYRRLENLRALRAIDAAITTSTNLELTLHIVLDEVIQQLGVHAADILLFNQHSFMLEYASGTGFRIKQRDRQPVSISQGPAWRAVTERTVVYIPNLLEKNSASGLANIEAEGFFSYYGIPLVAQGQVKGVLELFHRQPLAFDEERREFLEALASQTAIAIDNATLLTSIQRTNEDLTRAYNATILGWSKAMTLRDHETEEHSQRVTELTVQIARAMGIAEFDLGHIYRGALLHDIGKLGVPDHILLKPGKLTPTELEQMRQHPQYAYEMLKEVDYLSPALDIPYCHHEKWDGTGYPRGLRDFQIPLAARIFSVVDVWDALLSDRPYRPAWDAEQVEMYVQAESGKSFDPKVVVEFMRLWRRERSAGGTDPALS
jgi:HD-GYP domain-containing protein (c-di-GMP phosphodiesterase class II)